MLLLHTESPIDQIIDRLIGGWTQRSIRCWLLSLSASCLCVRGHVKSCSAAGAVKWLNSRAGSDRHTSATERHALHPRLWCYNCSPHSLAWRAPLADFLRPRVSGHVGGSAKTQVRPRKSYRACSEAGSAPTLHAPILKLLVMN